MTSENIYNAIIDSLQKGEKIALATVVSKNGSTPAKIGFKMLIYSNGKTIGTVGGGSIELEVRKIAIDVIKANSAKLVDFDLDDTNSICGGNMSVFIEPIMPSEKLFIFGAGHVGQVLSKLSALVGFNITIIDDREEYANPEIFPEAHKIVISDYQSSFSKLEMDNNSFIVIVTRGHAFDEIVLELACKTNAKYIGMIRSTRKVKDVFDNLRKKGISDDMLSKVYAPIGLDICSETSAEIAISILAQIIQINHS